MVAEPVLGRLAAQDAVAEVVILADDVGVRVMTLVVHDLPLGGVDVEVPLVAIRVVVAVARQGVVGAVQDVVAEFGELQQPIEHLEDGGAGDGTRSAVTQQFQAAGVDRLSVRGHRADVLKVGVPHRRPRLLVERL